jgi:hypothetical protein
VARAEGVQGLGRGPVVRCGASPSPCRSCGGVCDRLQMIHRGPPPGQGTALLRLGEQSWLAWIDKADWGLRERIVSLPAGELSKPRCLHMQHVSRECGLARAGSQVRGCQRVDADAETLTCTERPSWCMLNN